MTATPTVFVVDDNAAVRKSLHALLESVSLAAETYASGDEFLAAYDPQRPGCLVLDLRLHQASGLDLQDALGRYKAQLPIIILTGHGNIAASVRALKAGAVDFLQKPAPPQLLLERIHAALAMDRQARELIIQRATVLERLADLTPREHEVMELLVTGKTSKEIAVAMHVSVRTVEGHRHMALSKVAVDSAGQLVRSVMKRKQRAGRSLNPSQSGRRPIPNP